MPFWHFQVVVVGGWEAVLPAWFSVAPARAFKNLRLGAFLLYSGRLPVPFKEVPAPPPPPPHLHSAHAFAACSSHDMASGYLSRWRRVRRVRAPLLPLLPPLLPPLPSLTPSPPSPSFLPFPHPTFPFPFPTPPPYLPPCLPTLPHPSLPPLDALHKNGQWKTE